MRPIAATLLYLCFVFLGAALMAPWLYHGLQTIAVAYPQWRDLADSPFHRYLNRCLLILALLGLWPFLKSLGISTRQQLGFHSSRPLAHLTTGFLAAGLLVAFLALIALVSGAAIFANSPLRWGKHLSNAVPAAILVSVLEEILFRAGLFGAVRRTQPFWAAALFSSAIYALVHFFAKPVNPSHVTWLSGFHILGQMLGGFTEWKLFFPAFLNLILVGLIFTVAFDRTRAIYSSIGLHAGFIFGVKTYSFLTNPAPNANTWLWGSEKLVDGWAAFLVLSIALVLFIRSRVKFPSA